MKHLEISRFPQLDFSCRESMNTLATNLFYCGEDIRTVLITSRYADEGKSFVSINMMRTIASLQKRVVLLDADLRRSKLASLYRFRFEDTSPFGLAHYLAGKCQLEDIIHETNVENAFIVPIGREVASSLQLLSSSRMPKLMKALQDEFDMVIVDAPPAGVIVDALEIAKYCDGSLIVVSCNRGRRKDIADISTAIGNTGCPVLGAVLNNVDFGSYMNRKYYYKSERYATYYHGSYKPYSNNVGRRDK